MNLRVNLPKLYLYEETCVLNVDWVPCLESVRSHNEHVNLNIRDHFNPLSFHF